MKGAAAMKLKLPGRNFVFLDGAGGTMLQQRGLQPGQRPDLMNITAPDKVEEVHRLYVEAGSDIVYTNTFGSSTHALRGSGHSAADVITAGVKIAKKACDGKALVALDIGPIGELLYPLGEMTFDAAYSLFREQATIGEAAGADLAVIETMSDLGEMKAAILAVKENTALPVFATMTFNADGRTYTGCSAESFAITAQALGVDALGINCSLTPSVVYETVRKIAAMTDQPLVVKPNAGLPNEDSEYAISPTDYAKQMARLAELGVRFVGGCCGTTPEFIRALHEAFSDVQPVERARVEKRYICSASAFCDIDSPEFSLSDCTETVTLGADCDEAAVRDIITEAQELTTKPLSIRLNGCVHREAVKRAVIGVALFIEGDN